MRKRWLQCLLVLIALVVLTTCAPGKQSYRQGEELIRMGNWEGAIAFYTDALVQEPKNKKYQEALTEAQQKAAQKYYQRAVNIWDGSVAKDYQTVTRALAALNKAVEFDPHNEQILALHGQLKAKKDELTEQAKTSYQRGITALDNEQWFEAVTSFRMVNDIYPNYEDTEDKLARAVATGTDEYYKAGILAVQREDWKVALDNFGKVLAIDSSYKNTRMLIEEVKKK